jgi:farnesyl diphosphate synthase
MEQFEAFLGSHLPSAPSFHPIMKIRCIKCSSVVENGSVQLLLLGVVRAYNPLLRQSAYHAALAIELLAHLLFDS